MPRRSSAPLIVLFLAGLAIPSCAEAAWDFLGDILFTGGRAENPRLLDSDQPASQRGGQMEAASRLTLGARSRWEKSDFEFSYSPYGEFYEESDLNQVSHALGMAWNHRYTPRLSLGLKEDLSYNPKLPTDPNGAGLGGALLSDTSIAASDFKQTLTFRATGKTSLAWTYRNIQRVYSSDQLLDTAGNSFGMLYSRTFGPRVVVSGGYELGLYSFRDGLPPPVSSSLRDFCALAPLDPNCIAVSAAAAQLPAEDQGSQRHRAYAGYAYDSPAGFHVGLDGGVDLLVPTHDGIDSVSKPFLRSVIGWNGERLHTRVGYEQGLDEGGGILTNAELERVRADARARFTENASMDLSISHDVRRSLDIDGLPAGASLKTLRGAGSFTYKLTAGWALIAMFTHDRQTSSGTAVVPTESRASRYAVGASWTFAK